VFADSTRSRVQPERVEQRGLFFVDQRIFRGFRRSLYTWREAIGRYKQAQDTEEAARAKPGDSRNAQRAVRRAFHEVRRLRKGA
jgi:hypothetical protein